MAGKSTSLSLSHTRDRKEKGKRGGKRWVNPGPNEVEARTDQRQALLLLILPHTTTPTRLGTTKEARKESRRRKAGKTKGGRVSGSLEEEKKASTKTHTITLS